MKHLQEAQLRLKVSKCVFLKEKVQYLGHAISKQGIGPDPDKVATVQSFPILTDVHEL